MQIKTVRFEIDKNEVNSLAETMTILHQVKEMFCRNERYDYIMSSETGEVITKEDILRCAGIIEGLISHSDGKIWMLEKEH